jgi:AcrR family transcriptional regulator
VTAEPKRSRGRPATTGLSLDAIVDAALGLVDRDGLDALTVGRLAAELDVAPMSLYRYFRNKDELLDAVGDGLLGRWAAPIVQSAGPWEDELIEVLTSFHRLLVEHPAIAGLFITRHVVGPGTAKVLERMLAILRRGGFDASEAVAAYRIVIGFVMGYSVYDVGHRVPEYGRRSRSFFAGLSPEEFPALTDSFDALGQAPESDLFTAGLRDLLAGLTRTAKHARRAAGDG